jgi:hypothetical protein
MAVRQVHATFPLGRRMRPGFQFEVEKMFAFTFYSGNKVASYESFRSPLAYNYLGGAPRQKLKFEDGIVQPRIEAELVGLNYFEKNF